MKQNFNPKSRWDRHIPDNNNNLPASLDEKIEVLAWFRKGKAYPQVFTWEKIEYKIETITYTWQERRGQDTISYFSVSTGIDLYQISFNSTSLSWRLDKII